MGKTYVEIWVQWARQNHAAAYEKPGLLWVLLRIVAAALFLFGSCLFVYMTSLSETRWAAVGFLCLIAGWMGWSFYSQRPFGGKAIEKLEGSRELARISMPEYLKELKVGSSKLPDIMVSIKEYYNVENRKRESFRNKTFNFLFCGVIVQLSMFALCSVMVVVSLLASVLWDLFDNCRTASLAKTRGAIRMIECSMLDLENEQGSL